MATPDHTHRLASSWRFDGHSVILSPDGHAAFAVCRGLDGAPTAVWTDIDTGKTRASASVAHGHGLPRRGRNSAGLADIGTFAVDA
ncbi:MAG: hypothetical protein ABI880_01410, partial [Acidobacteriota bacterium]